MTDTSAPIGAPIGAPVVAPSIDTIKRMAAAHFGVSEIDITSARRDRQTVIARHTAMLLARELTRHSYPVIGRLFGDRNHSTVLDAVRSIQGRMRQDPTIAASVDAVRRSVRPPPARFFVGWRHTGTGDRGHGSVALTEAKARPLMDTLKAEDTGNYAYELVPAAEIETWKGQTHGQARE